MTELTNLFNRANTIASAPDHTIRQRLADNAAVLNLAGHMQAHLDACKAAIVALINVIYDIDADGIPANYDPLTGRIYLPVPWGESGWRKWGSIRRWEALALRRLLIERAQSKRRLAPLFDYNADSRIWHLNYTDYPTPEAALGWLRSDGPTLTEWRTLITDSREQAAERMRKHRARQ